MAPRTAVDTRRRLIDATVESLIEQGYAATTGVEVCRRAELTRGALNHHYPDFTDLLADALEAAYAELLPASDARAAEHSLETWVRSAHRHLSKPAFKAVIELWLASQNEPEIGAAMTEHVRSLAWLFTPDTVLGDQPEAVDRQFRAALYRTVAESFIGLGLGRASQGGQPLVHEPQVVEFLAQLAAAADRGELQSVLPPAPFQPGDRP
ncbi:MAG: TetR/AcrR family transcriptional regulator [Actinomycetota bacterium]